jgi:hypothetical protein
VGGVFQRVRIGGVASKQASTEKTISFLSTFNSSKSVWSTVQSWGKCN